MLDFNIFYKQMSTTYMPIWTICSIRTARFAIPPQTDHFPDAPPVVTRRGTHRG